eukprot:scaffold102850_cov63-Phaeocystis_antarctica.AAC.3
MAGQSGSFAGEEVRIFHSMCHEPQARSTKKGSTTNVASETRYLPTSFVDTKLGAANSRRMNTLQPHSAAHIQSPCTAQSMGFRWCPSSPNFSPAKSEIVHDHGVQRRVDHAAREGPDRLLHRPEVAERGLHPQRVPTVVGKRRGELGGDERLGDRVEQHEDQHERDGIERPESCDDLLRAGGSAAHVEPDDRGHRHHAEHPLVLWRLKERGRFLALGGARRRRSLLRGWLGIRAMGCAHERRSQRRQANGGDNETGEPVSSRVAKRGRRPTWIEELGTAWPEPKPTLPPRALKPRYSLFTLHWSLNSDTSHDSRLDSAPPSRLRRRAGDVIINGPHRVVAVKDGAQCPNSVQPL